MEQKHLEKFIRRYIVDMDERGRAILIRKIMKCGTSTVIPIPNTILKAYGFNTEDYVQVIVDRGLIIIRKIREEV